MELLKTLADYLNGSFNKPTPPRPLTCAELLSFITGIRSEQELLEIERLVDLMRMDGDLNEDEQFELYSTIAYMISLFVHIEDHFPHEYYPPFAIQGHIRHAEDLKSLNAIALHLRVNEHVYTRQLGSNTLQDFRREAAQKLALKAFTLG